MRKSRMPGAGHPPRLPAKIALERLLYGSLPFFMSQLVDPAGKLLEVPPHIQAWCELMESWERLALLAPRSHGKTTVAIGNILWRVWRHGRDPASGGPRVGPAGRYSVVVFSATHEQASSFLWTLRDLVLANAWLFEPPATGSAAGRQPTRWSERRIRFANGAEISTRAYGTSTRGLHPDLLVLDDVLNNENSLSQHQRDVTWQYLAGTLLPMSPGRVVIVGSAIHQADLLHHLDAPSSAGLGFQWVKYKAIDPESETALWPARHPYTELVEFRAAEPTIFSREYQNEPRDDAASIFPYELTGRALEAGAGFTFAPTYDKEFGELIVLGADFAVSEAARADFSVIIVAAFNAINGRRRVLAAERHKGLDLAGQIALRVDLSRRYGVQIGIVEQNGFQRWLLDALRPWPDVLERIHGHTTGREKSDPVDGVLGLKLKLQANLWIMPSGDEESGRFGRVWQAEMSAFGWTDGRLAGLGEHDDTVMASWFVELAVRFVQELLDAPTEQVVTGEDLGIERVRIGSPYDEDDALTGPANGEGPVRIGPDY